MAIVEGAGGIAKGLLNSDVQIWKYCRTAPLTHSCISCRRPSNSNDTLLALIDGHSRSERRFDFVAAVIRNDSCSLAKQNSSREVPQEQQKTGRLVTLSLRSLATTSSAEHVQESKANFRTECMPLLVLKNAFGLYVFADFVLFSDQPRIVLYPSPSSYSR